MFSWANVSKHMGSFVQMHAHFLTVRPFDQQGFAFDAQHITPHCFDALPYFLIALQEIRQSAFPFSTVRSPTHCRDRRIGESQAHYHATRHHSNVFRDRYHESLPGNGQQYAPIMYVRGRVLGPMSVPSLLTGLLCVIASEKLCTNNRILLLPGRDKRWRRPQSEGFRPVSTWLGLVIAPVSLFPFGLHTAPLYRDHSVEFCNILLGERIDRLPFVCQPVLQRFLLDPPCVRKPEFTRDYADAVDADPDVTHFAIVMWKSRHNLFQDHVGGCLTRIVLENRQREICLRIAASFD